MGVNAMMGAADHGCALSEDKVTISFEEAGAEGKTVITVTAAIPNAPIKRRSPVTGEWLREIDEAYHAVCDIFRSDGEMSLCCAFSVEAYWVAIPDDIAPQQEVNRALMAAIRTKFAGDPDLATKLVDQVEADWRGVHATLESRWADARAVGMTPDHSVMVETMDGEGPHLAIMAPSTKQGEDCLCGVIFEPHYEMYLWQTLPAEYVTISPVTGKYLMGRNEFSGHSKLDLLSGGTRPEVVKEFEAYRRPNGRVRPRRPGGGAE